MDWEIEKKEGIPLYQQVKEVIKEKIYEKEIIEGERIPTERDMAKQLHVSRNTISAAYKELEAEGIIVSQQGKGTFVADSSNRYKREGCKERLLRMIDLAMEEAIELGFGLDRFLSITYGRVEEKKRLLTELTVGFVECNNEQLYALTRQLSQELSVKIEPFLLPELRERKKELADIFQGIDILVTTVFHHEELAVMTADLNKMVIPIPLDAGMKTLIKIAQIPQGTKVGLACFSENFETRVRNSLVSAEINRLPVLTTTSDDEKELRAFLGKIDVVLASPEKKKQIAPLLPPNVELIELVYNLDSALVSRLKAMILGFKREWNIH
ncbi:MAG: GntR family transcriptional regulator [bacterium]